MPSFGKKSSEHRFQDVEVSKKLRSLKALKETVRHIYFLNSPFIVIHVYSRCISGESAML